ncbi:MAG: hypothetical protein IJ747_01445 [Lachnospiraceae bacterium]|nr:hypothetical protein [Lachnospiraceae bacterium]
MYSEPIRPVTQYERKIRYLDYIENGERVRGAGFVKIERRDELCNISLQVSGLYRKDRFTRPFLLVGEEGEKELYKLQLTDGGIKTYFGGLDSNDLGGQGISYEALCGIRIPISEGKEIRCIWKTAEGSRQEVAEVPEESRQEVAELSEIVAVPAESGDRSDAESVGETQFDADGMESQVSDTGEVDTGRPDTGETDTGRPDMCSTNADLSAEDYIPQESEQNMVLQEHKWEQLWMIYPHIRPFSDDREYLTIGPGDFVLLQENSYRLVNNSFLLHGYYEFHHLLLMRMGPYTNPRYYIGVPGNLYERDKQSAILFGFQGFECANEPAEEGDFGYYMISVEL